MGFLTRLARQGGRALLFCGFSIVVGPVFGYLAFAAMMAASMMVFDAPAGLAMVATIVALPLVHVVGFVPAILFSFLMSTLLIVVRKSSAVLLSPMIGALTAVPAWLLMAQGDHVSREAHVWLGMLCIAASFAGFATTFWAYAKGLLPGCREV